MDSEDYSADRKLPTELDGCCKTYSVGWPNATGIIKLIKRMLNPQAPESLFHRGRTCLDAGQTRQAPEVQLIVDKTRLDIG
jgi:hypothetical protein